MLTSDVLQGAHTLEGLHPELFNRKRKRDREAESESSEEAEAEIKEEKMFHPKLAFKPSTANKSYEGYLQL